MSAVFDWIEGDDSLLILASFNGHGRGDGYDVYVYQSVSTGRYIMRVVDVPSKRSRWYVARTLEGAKAVAAQGWTPGHGPGSYHSVSNPNRLKEVTIHRRSGGADD